MMFRRVGTQLFYDVTNPALIPLFQGNEAYEEIVTEEPKEEAEKPKKTTKKKATREE